MVRPRLRLLPVALCAMALLLALKLDGVLRGPPHAGTTAPPRLALVASARAGPDAPAPARTATTPAAAPAGGAASLAATPDPPTAEQRAERALLEGLRARRTAIEERDAAVTGREMVLAAAERRLVERVEALAALQAKLELADRARSEREEAGWRGMVKLYEGMRPRDAAAIFDELEMPVLVGIVDRMREAKAAPVLGAMRPDRARMLTAELARARARPAE